ncbi:hypothetical protein F5888DRAFT_1597255, partial [Russula emetica]
LRDSMICAVANALEFVLETWTVLPTGKADLCLQPSADSMMKGHYCVVPWNDERHSFSEAIKLRLLCLHTSTSRKEAAEIANCVDD